MHKTTALRRLIEKPELLVMPGCFDVLSAMLIERAGFPAVQVSGLGVAASLLGKPDVGVVGQREMVERVFQISQSVTIPVMADADTGWGNAVNVYFAVRELEHAGAAGINLEDQSFPKRCGHMEGKSVIAAEEMVGKVRAAREAARDPDFVINARTDALTEFGIDEAIRRGNAYARAGATMIYVEAIETEDQIRRAVAEIDAPVSITLGEGGRTPLLSFARLQELGVARASCPGTALFAAIRGIQEALNALRVNDGPAGHAPRISSLLEYRDLLGMPRVAELEGRFSV